MENDSNLFDALKTEYTQRITREEEFGFLLDYVGEIEGCTLEIGCNLGFLSKEIYNKKRTNVIGIDTNNSRLVRFFANQRVEDLPIKFYVMDGAKTTFDNNYFDEIVISHVFESCDDPSVLLTEVKRILKKHGRLIIAVAKDKILEQFSSDNKILFSSTEDLKRILKQNGFQVLRSQEKSEFIVVIARPC